MEIKAHLNIKYIVPFFAVLSIVIVSSCNENGKKEKEESPVEVNLSQEEAIAKLQHYVQSESKALMVQTYYYEWKNTRVKCTQYDIDVGRKCSEPRVGAPHGYRNERKRVRKCCEYEPKLVSGFKGKWVAEHRLEDDKWSVSLEIDAGELTKTLVWQLDDNSSEITDNNDYKKKE